MGIITGILSALAIYAVLWFFVVQYNLAIRNSRNEGFKEGENHAVREKFHRLEERFERIEIEKSRKEERNKNRVPHWFNPMPAHLLERLNDISLGDAMDNGLILQAGDGKDFIKVFIVDEIDFYYAIIDGYTLKISSGLTEILSTTKDDNLLATVLFSTGYLEYEHGEYREFQLYLPNL